MNSLVLAGYELLTVCLPFIIVFGVFSKISKRNNRPAPPLHFFMMCVFAAYIFAVFYFTRAGTLFEWLRYGREIHLGQYNFLPFSQHIDTVAYVQNILLFMPLGFLLPLIWPKADQFRHALLSGLALSLLIEISQMLNHRATDVDDLLMNTAGAIAGYGAYKLFSRLTGWRTGRPDYLVYEPLIYVGAMFAGRFLLLNEMGLAKILYGF